MKKHLMDFRAMRFSSIVVFFFGLGTLNTQVPTALEASGAIRPGDVIVSVNGIPLPGAGCYKRDAALLEAPGMFPMRIKIKRPSPPSSDAGGGDPGDWGEGWGDVGMGTGGSGGLESSLSRLKQVRSIGVLMFFYHGKGSEGSESGRGGRGYVRSAQPFLPCPSTKCLVVCCLTKNSTRLVFQAP